MKLILVSAKCTEFSQAHQPPCTFQYCRMSLVSKQGILVPRNFTGPLSEADGSARPESNFVEQRLYSIAHAKQHIVREMRWITSSPTARRVLAERPRRYSGKFGLSSQNRLGSYNSDGHVSAFSGC